MFAVIDTETTYADEVMSIGIVMADEETFRPVDARYYIIAPAYQTGGMFSHVLQRTEHCTLPFAQRVCSRRDALEDLRAFMARTRSLPTTRILTGATCRSCGRIIGATLCGRPPTASLTRPSLRTRTAMRRDG